MINDTGRCGISADIIAAGVAADHAFIASLGVGTIRQCSVYAEAYTKGDDGKKDTFGVFVCVAPEAYSLLRVDDIAGGHQALTDIIDRGSVTVKILAARMENGRPLIHVSQKAVGDIAGSTENVTTGSI